MKCPACGAAIETATQAVTVAQCPRCERDLATDAPADGALADARFRERFALGPLIGRGGFGSVYRAREIATGREVAVKLLDAHSEDAVARFSQEARLMRSIDHPGVVPVIATGVSAGHPYLVSEYMTGGSLRERIDRQTKIPAKDAVRIAEECLDALARCHERGVIHRDLKPDNILFDAQDRPRIADFGVAKDYGRRIDLTQPMQRIGTPRYMAPELRRGEAPSVASDLYALAVLVREMIVGTVPPAGPDGALPPLAGTTPELPPALCVVLDRATAKRPADRPALAVDLSRALRAALSGDAIVPALPAPARARPRRRAAVGVAVIAVVAAGLFAWKWSGRADALVREAAAAAARGDHAGAARMYRSAVACAPERRILRWRQQMFERERATELQAAGMTPWNGPPEDPVCDDLIRRTRALYRTCLLREPDEAGLKYWASANATLDFGRVTPLDKLRFREQLLAIAFVVCDEYRGILAPLFLRLVCGGPPPASDVAAARREFAATFSGTTGEFITKLRQADRALLQRVVADHRPTIERWRAIGGRAVASELERTQHLTLTDDDRAVIAAFSEPERGVMELARRLSRPGTRPWSEAVSEVVSSLTGLDLSPAERDELAELVVDKASFERLLYVIVQTPEHLKLVRAD